MAFLISAGLDLEAKEKKYMATLSTKLQLKSKNSILYTNEIISIQESEGETFSSK